MTLCFKILCGWPQLVCQACMGCRTSCSVSESSTTMSPDFVHSACRAHNPLQAQYHRPVSANLAAQAAKGLVSTSNPSRSAASAAFLKGLQALIKWSVGGASPAVQKLSNKVKDHELMCKNTSNATQNRTHLGTMGASLWKKIRLGPKEKQ